MTRINDIEFSVVIPLHNEELLVKELLDRTVAAMDTLGASYEILPVNDGSTDSTKEKICSFSARNDSIKPVLISNQKGQTHAMAKGFGMAKGRIIISLDGDLQNDPADIPLLIKKMEETGADAVCGWRKYRNDPVHTILLSRIGNFFQKIIFNVGVHDISCTLRSYKRQAIRSLDLKKAGLHRFIPVLLRKKGFTIEEVIVKHHDRKLGESKYSVSKAPQTIRLCLEILFGAI